MSLPLWFVHPQQGVFRDLDVLAPSAVAIAFVAAWAIGRAIEDSRASHGLAVAVAGTCLACTVGWLALMHDANRAEGWVREFVTPEARRSPIERALTWDFLGYRAFNASNWGEAAHAWRETQYVLATPRTLTQLAMAETMAGDLEAARSHFRGSLALDSTQAVCWRGIATTSFRLGDYREARRAAGKIQRLGAAFSELPDLLRALDRLEAQPVVSSPPRAAVPPPRLERIARRSSLRPS
jgi:tetratricopeptide (TPR) repeat protein